MSTNNNVFTTALKYHAGGRCVLPSGGGPQGKSPLVSWTEFQKRLPTEVELHQWQSQFNPKLWGIVTGKISGIFIVDADNATARDLLEKVDLQPHILTPRGGAHYHFRYPGFHVKTVAGILPGIDVRGDGGFVNLIGERADGQYTIIRPPENGNLYYFEQLPGELQKALRLTKTTKPKVEPMGEKIAEGKRNRVLTSLAGTMRRRGMNQAAIEAALLQTNAAQCQPPLPEREVREIAKSVSRYEPKQKQDASRNYITLDKKGNQVLDLAQLATDLLSEFRFATLNDTDEALMYQDGYYQQNGTRFIKQECQRRVGVTSLLTKHKVNEVIGHIKRSTYVDRATFNADKFIINLQNGLLDVRTCQLEPHTPDFLSTIRIPVSYEPNSDCPAIKRFLNEVHHPEDVPIIQELFGYCLIPDYTIQKAFLFVGDGDNGKSTELNLLRAFVGKANCSNVPWHALELNRFAKSALEGKLANSFADLPSQSLSLTGIFKMLTGGDTIGTEKKFGDYYSFVNFARLVFSANKPPKIFDEDSHAFWRRWIILDFPNQFTDERRDLNMLAKLTTPDELSGLLNFALDGLGRLLANQSFSYQKSVDETTEYYLRASDPVYAFIQDMCESSSDEYVSKDELYEAFCGYCKANNTPLLKPNAFARSLQNQTVIRIKSTRPMVEGKRVTAWQGIKLVKDVKDVNVSYLSKGCAHAEELQRSNGKNFDNPDNPDRNTNSDNLPDYPTHPCHNCGCGDYWLTDWNTWLCSRCHPKPKGED